MMRKFSGLINSAALGAALLLGAGQSWGATAVPTLNIEPGPGDWWQLDLGSGYKQYGTQIEDAENLQVIPHKGAQPTTLAQALNAPEGATVLAYRFIAAPFMNSPLCRDVPANWIGVMFPPEGQPVFAAVNWASPSDRDSTICWQGPIQATPPES